MPRSKKLITIVVGAVAALALGSFAFAAIPDAGGVIHGCYDKASGHLRVTDTATNLPKTCTSKEAVIDWNQQGPQGDRGPSNAYTAEWGYKLTTANTDTLVVSRTLPPGSYVVSAKLYVTANGLNVAPMVVDCSLHAGGAGGSSVDYAEGTVSSNASGDVLVTTLALENNSSWPLANGGTVSLACESPLPAQVHHAKITAIRVDSVD